jgi:ParB-like chromosome segregation protein Spo0J
MQVQIKQVAVEKLIPYVRNSRTHSDAQVAQIAASIKEFGWTNPILVDGTNGIIAGHGRLLAARKLEQTEVPVIELAHMTESQKKAYVIADNQLAMNAGWDTSMLTLELSDLKDSDFDLNVIGFSAEDMKTFTQEINFDAGSEEDQGKLDQLDPKWICCPNCGKEFDAREA